MSEVSTMVTTKLVRYLAAHTAEEDDFLKRLKRDSQIDGIQPIWIAPEQGNLMQILLRLARARTVVEIGTLVGYSAIVMARALPADGMLHTLEISPEYADRAQRWIDQSDVKGSITIHRGDAVHLLPGFKDESLDAAFIDADKGNYPVYLHQCLRIVKPGGLILVDNAFAYGQLLDENPSRKDDVWAIQQFNALMAKERRLESVIVPIGDGMWVAHKK